MTARRLTTATVVAGFTIIEVMIVLAVAAVILLIVLLAVPAFQRNQRNTARKQDVGRLASAILRFYSNNSAMPSSNADAGTVITEVSTFGGYSGLAGASPVGTAANTKLSIVAAGAGTPAALATTLIDSVQVVTGGICSGAGATNVGAVSRNYAIQYTLETGTPGTSATYCQNGG